MGTLSVIRCALCSAHGGDLVPGIQPRAVFGNDRRDADVVGLHRHLVHHLHPIVPFYRYLAVWRRNEERYLEGDPALSTVGGRPLTVDEYRELCKLAEHEH